MSSESNKATGIFAAVALSHHKISGSGNAFVLEARDLDEQNQLTIEIAKALKADVLKLSNGLNIILRA